ncbi:LTA synthase family protein [Otariodibacter oris]|uniref:Phosphoglycerol transferase MdoB-like AlkP superfamily enzyme n=1 Tax=Otariodibacter oris TaxID=1032623 RepID=A0A420XF78_9PAST|nr:alkaline phosphatase family protein [Otariodibacter oris]QGM81511.1 hypothetical protein A6A10_08875 [Otariodibacter oris]RKR71117.1 phosphoglycerol transferase MdoB-like AlkP superfamily enzyme [Otariodibacter oris]
MKFNLERINFISIPLRIILFGLIAFTLSRLGFYFVHSDYFSPLNSSEVVSGLLTGIQFDSATVMLFCSPMLALLSLPFKVIHETKLKILLVWLSALVIFVMLGYNMADLTYFGEVQRHIGAEIANLSSDQAALIEIALSSRLTYTLSGLVFLIILFIGWYYFVVKPSSPINPLISSKLIKGLSWLGLAVVYLILFRGIILSGRPINLSDAFNGSKLQQANLSLNPVYTSYREIRNKLEEKPLNYLSQEEVQNFIKNSPLIFQWQHSENTLTKKNVVLILLESWSYKYIDALSHNQYGVTPFMDSLVARSQVWDNYYAAGQRSIIGIQAILSSVPSLQSQPTLGFGLEMKDMSRIAQIASDYDYRTVMMQSSARRSFHMDSIANALGFQEYYGKEDVPIIKEYPQEQPRFGWDYDALQAFNQKLSETENNKPFFAFMFTGTTHEPFPKIGKEFELYPHDDKSENGFLNTLKYSDWALEQFMQSASLQPWYNNTVFIFSADHVLNAKTDDTLDQRFHIPLVIFTPDGSLPPARNTKLASQYDLFPTIMDILGFNQSIFTFGKSLFSNEESESVMLNQGDMVGMVTPNNWVGFTQQNIEEVHHELSEEDQQQLNKLKLKIQYADQLLRQNRWTKP